MKKFILIAFAIIGAFTFSVLPVFAETEISPAQVYHNFSIEKGEEVNYYEDFAEAYTNAEPGDTINLLLNYDAQTTQYVINENLTIDLGNSIFAGAQFVIRDGANVTFTGKNADGHRGTLGTYYSDIPKTIIIENGIVTIDNIRVVNSNSDIPEEYSEWPMIQVGVNDSDDEAKLIVDNNSFILAYTNAIHTFGNNSSVEIRSADLVEGHKYGIAMSGTDNVVDIKDGTINGGSNYAAISTHIESVGAKVNISGGRIIQSVWAYGTSPVVTITDDALIECGSTYGMQVGGTDALIDIQGGVVSGAYGGIFGYSLADNSTIKLSGGTVKPYVNPEVTLQEGYNHTGMTLEKVGNLIVDGGTVEGDIPILLMQGNVTVNSGKINGYGTGDNYVLWGTEDRQYRAGTAICVDNEDDNFPEDAKVEINGGEFTATDDESLFLYGDNFSDYVVNGGVFNKQFNEEFVAPGKLELNIKLDDTQKWYVGEDATKAVEESKNNSNAVIEVHQGDLVVEDAVAGVTVKNSGEGTVTVNDIDVNAGETIVVSEFLKGDVDKSGIVDAVDASKILTLFKNQNATEEEIELGDVDGTPGLTAVDAMTILTAFKNKTAL